MKKEQPQQPQELCEELFQVSDEIPYKRIETLKIINISQESINAQIKYKIQLDQKIQEKPKSNENSILIRNSHDFEWLVQKLKQNTERFLIVPKLQFNYKWESLLPSFVANLTKTELSKKQQIFRKQYHQKMLFRLMTILANISLKFSYWKPRQFSTPLYIFISTNDNYDFYKKLSERKAQGSNSNINNLFSGILNKSKNIFNYIPIYQKTNSQSGGLADIKRDAEIVYTRGEKLMDKFKIYKNQLQILHQNFLGCKQQFRKRMQSLMVLIFRLNNQIKFAKLILDQIQAIIKQYQTFIQKQKYIDQELMLYKEYIAGQIKDINNSVKKIGIQYIEYNVVKANTIKIEIGNLYENYKIQMKEGDHRQKV